MPGRWIAGLIAFDDRFERSAGRKRPRPGGPELQAHGVRVVARIADQNAAGGLEMMDGKREARGGRRADVDDVAAGRAEPFGRGRHEFGRQRAAVAGEEDGGRGKGDWG